jgi:histidinol-phosphatase
MPFDERRDLDRALDAIRKSLVLASRASLRHFRAGVVVERKPDRSPVTAADRESEAAILGELLAAFPEASVLAEESGERAGDPELRFIVDPLDGTRGFTRGGSFWGPLVALEHRGEIVAGGAALPALGESYVAARGRGCFDATGAPVRVSSLTDWSEATLSLGEMRALRATPQAYGVERLADEAASVRCYGDVAGALMALTGRAEAWLEAGVKPWDIAPMKVLFEEAGGRFTDLAGHATIAKGSAVATNGALHDYVIGALSARPENS